MGTEAMLVMNDISKSFSGVRVLDNVCFQVARGQCHGLVGENGAGKTTLMKILTGIYHRDPGGSILLGGKPVEPSHYENITEIGISMVYQETNVIHHMSVAENIFLQRQPRKRGFIDWKRMYDQSAETLDRIGIQHIDVRRPIKEFSTGIQQFISIARAVSLDARLIIMDEPTSSLDDKEIGILFTIIKRLVGGGTSLIFISHKLDELFKICNRVSVLRDGKNSGDFEINEISKFQLVSAMIGQPAEDLMPTLPVSPLDAENAIALQAIDISDHGKLHNCDIEIRQGEIVGLAGLLGSGRSTLANVLFGINDKKEGIIRIEGQPAEFRSPIDAISRGLAYLTEDRKATGVIPEMSIKENLTISALNKVSRFGFINQKREERLVRDFIGRLGIKCNDINDPLSVLSGGNQQKVLLARLLLTEPRLIILDSPTRGIDIKSKGEIEAIVDGLRQRGVSFLLISSELPELTRNCSRLTVMSNGHTSHVLMGNEITEENIMKAIAEGHAGGESDA